MSSEANKQTIKRQRAGRCPRSLPKRERLGLHPRESQGYAAGSFMEFPADAQVLLAWFLQLPLVSSMAFRGCGLTHNAFTYRAQLTNRNDGDQNESHGHRMTDTELRTLSILCFFLNFSLIIGN